jgi:hypothetical protein
MNTVVEIEKQKVGVVFIREGGCCQKHLTPMVDSVRSMLDEISAEAGIPILIKDITGRDAVSGALPANLAVQCIEIFRRIGSGGIPGIIINGKIVAFGPQPDKADIKEDLLNASPIKP